MCTYVICYSIYINVSFIINVFPVCIFVEMMDQQSGAKEVWHDWVGELFEPVFGATIEDLVSHEPEPKNKPRVKHVSIHDPEAVRKV